MRLSSIKLAGFKSFVDPTQLPLVSNRTGIVGPNGCGKSNIIDAIYFVLGSHSKNLRADMMADVIFNGTTNRKPVAQAVVELIFDNSDARIAGEYANYAEISIRREVTRDGQSNYYINGTRCRKRDVTDLFLGTGLGQNSYAIIEQGMISRLIEAKPEELRAYVEEAAGTSKYKERRRETENRIRHTKDNLDRLNDIREEQGKQLNHLQRQANAAKRYQELKSEQRLLRAQLHAIGWQDVANQIKYREDCIQSETTLLEEQQAKLTHIHKDIENYRFAQTEHHDTYSAIQENYYKLGATITQIEQNIAHSKEQRQRLESEQQKLLASSQELERERHEDEARIEKFRTEIDHIQGSYEQLQQQSLQANELLNAADEDMTSWQNQWDEFNQFSAQSAKQIEVEKTKVIHLEQKQQAILQRIAKIRDEEAKQNYEGLATEILELQSEQKECERQLSSLQERIEMLQDNINERKHASQEANAKVGSLTKDLRDLQARYASMEALQQIALGKNNTKRNSWLEQNGLTSHQRLAEGLEVIEGYEVPVETVLAAYLDAICIDDFSELQAAIASLQEADVSFFNIKQPVSAGSTSRKLVSLSEKIVSNLPIVNLLQHIYLVENLEEALQLLADIEPHESLITRDGIWLSQTWLKIARTVHQTTGVIQREHDIKELQGQITKQQRIIKEQELLAQESQEQLHYLNEEKETMQHQLQILRSKNSEFNAQIKAKEAYCEKIKQQQFSLRQEIEENDHALEDVEQHLVESKEKLIILNRQEQDDSDNRQRYLSQRDHLKQKLDEARRIAGEFKQKVDEQQIRLEANTSQIQLLQQNLGRVVKQLDAIHERKEIVEKTLSEINDPLPELTHSLQEVLAERAGIEDSMRQAKQKLGEIENSLKQFEQQRHEIEKVSHETRTRLEDLRVNKQSLIVKNENHLEQIKEAGFLLENLLQELPEQANATEWEETIAKLDNRILRLGPINLAAIDEYTSLLERKEFLDKQNDDLIEALTTLENAIRKIDRETKVRFKETYDHLNSLFREYFTQIFGGGNAYLELTSDDLLETGVIVRAQPPGKKNTTIHLLSGGEKALTAIALVFAIFNLNPAPFCVLDEVDAPLDDSNVNRFCNLVQKMSEKVQFLFISHNKITIEMAEQLAGVTMHEPGVSRLVSVDINQAINMATSGAKVAEDSN